MIINTCMYMYSTGRVELTRELKNSCEWCDHISRVRSLECSSTSARVLEWSSSARARGLARNVRAILAYLLVQCDRVVIL